MNKHDFDGLDWLREIRKEIITECKNNPKLMGDYYRTIQKQYGKNIIKDILAENSMQKVSFYISPSIKDNSQINL